MNEMGMYKLTTGEEIIGKVTATSDNHIVIEQPHTIHVVQKSPGKYGLVLMPYSPGNPEGTHKVFKNAVVSSPIDIPRELVDEYTRLTTNIEIVTSLEGV